MNLEAYNKGFSARRLQNAPVTANPYKYGTSEYRWWLQGWCDCEQWIYNVSKDKGE